MYLVLAAVANMGNVDGRGTIGMVSGGLGGGDKDTGGDGGDEPGPNEPGATNKGAAKNNTESGEGKKPTKGA